MNVYHRILHRYITLLGQLNFSDIYYISPTYTVSSALKSLPVCIYIYISSKYIPNIHSYTHTHIYSVNEKKELVIHRGSLCRTWEHVQMEEFMKSDVRRSVTTLFCSCVLQVRNGGILYTSQNERWSWDWSWGPLNTRSVSFRLNFPSIIQLAPWCCPNRNPAIFSYFSMSH